MSSSERTVQSHEGLSPRSREEEDELYQLDALRLDLL